MWGKSKLSRGFFSAVPLLIVMFNRLSAQTFCGVQTLTSTAPAAGDSRHPWPAAHGKMDEDNNDVVIKLCGIDDQFDCVAIGPEEAKHIGLVNNFLCEDDDDDDDNDDDDDDDDKNEKSHEIRLDKAKHKALEKF